MVLMKKLFLILLFCFGLTANFVAAQEMTPDKTETMKGVVTAILKTETTTLPGTNTTTTLQTITATILEGSEQDKVVTISNDYMTLAVGEKFYLTHTTNPLDGSDWYAVSEPDRLPALYFFLGLFLLVVIFFGGKQGIRGLLALIMSIGFILMVMLPGILHGYSPLLVAIGTATLIIILGSYITHGVNRTTSAAVVGMIATIALTGILAALAVKFTRLSGFANEEAVYLNFNTQGTIDFAGLLLGGMVIGLLGVLYDAAIGQAVAVEELADAGQHLSQKVIFKKALRIGREHIGALVNTLAIAYVGASLPLLLLYSTGNAPLHISMNREIFATEIIRAIVGSIGLILAVPITTLIATSMLVKKKS